MPVEYNRRLMPGDPTNFNLLDYFLGEERLDEIGHRAAIEFRANRITYQQLRDDVDFWARQLLDRSVTEGDRVALPLYDSPEFVACFLAAVSVGAIGVPINTFLTANDIDFILADSGALLMIAESELLGKVDSSGRCSVLTIDSANRPQLRQQRSDAGRHTVAATTLDTPAFLLYTS